MGFPKVVGLGGNRRLKARFGRTEITCGGKRHSIDRSIVLFAQEMPTYGTSRMGGYVRCSEKASQMGEDDMYDYFCVRLCSRIGEREEWGREDKHVRTYIDACVCACACVRLASGERSLLSSLTSSSHFSMLHSVWRPNFFSMSFFHITVSGGLNSRLCVCVCVCLQQRLHCL